MGGWAGKEQLVSPVRVTTRTKHKTKFGMKHVPKRRYKYNTINSELNSERTELQMNERRRNDVRASRDVFQLLMHATSLELERLLDDLVFLDFSENTGGPMCSPRRSVRSIGSTKLFQLIDGKGAQGLTRPSSSGRAKEEGAHAFPPPKEHRD